MEIYISIFKHTLEHGDPVMGDPGWRASDGGFYQSVALHHTTERAVVPAREAPGEPGWPGNGGANPGSIGRVDAGPRRSRGPGGNQWGKWPAAENGGGLGARRSQMARAGGRMPGELRPEEPPQFQAQGEGVVP